MESAMISAEEVERRLRTSVPGVEALEVEARRCPLSLGEEVMVEEGGEAGGGKLELAGHVIKLPIEKRTSKGTSVTSPARTPSSSITALLVLREG